MSLDPIMLISWIALFNNDYQVERLLDTRSITWSPMFCDSIYYRHVTRFLLAGPSICQIFCSSTSLCRCGMLHHCLSAHTSILTKRGPPNWRLSTQWLFVVTKWVRVISCVERALAFLISFATYSVSGSFIELGMHIDSMSPHGSSSWRDSYPYDLYVVKNWLLVRRLSVRCSFLYDASGVSTVSKHIALISFLLPNQ